MKKKYIGDTGWLDGCSYGVAYDVKQCETRPEAYTVLKNDLGGSSHLIKDKFVDVDESEAGNE